ncbi:MAG: hypothetical protein PHI52_05075 [Bacteroidales bacterium]|nr:hypothetical protein [Bacteroidales bacterium]
MNQSYNATLSPYALPQFLPTWGGKGGVIWGDLEVCSLKTMMFEKYPSISPYTYCANNPMKYVDPTGEKLVITGEASSEAVGQLEDNTSKKFNLIYNNNGTVRYEGKARNRADRLLKRTIDNQNVTVKIEAENANKDGKFVSRDGMHEYATLDGIPLGGAYGGSTVSEDGTSIAYQNVSPKHLAYWDDKADGKKGEGMLHEVMEGYASGKMAYRSGKGDVVGGNRYSTVHRRANRIAKGDVNRTEYTETTYFFDITTRKFLTKSRIQYSK